MVLEPRTSPHYMVLWNLTPLHGALEPYPHYMVLEPRTSPHYMVLWNLTPLHGALEPHPITW